MEQAADLGPARPLEAEALGQRERLVDERRSHVPRLLPCSRSLRTGTPTASARSGASTTPRGSRTRSAGAPSSRSRPAADDRFRVALVVVDMQNTFCTPGFELFVAGRSGTGALDDSRRLCEFVYRNLGSLTQIVPTLDTHQALQIFHRALLVDAEGRHPEPFTLVTADDVEAGRWRINQPAADGLGLDPDYAEEHLRYYTRTLEEGGKYSLTDLALPRHARRDRLRARLRARGGALLPFDRPQCAARLPAEGRSPADRALLDARPGGGVRPRG